MTPILGYLSYYRLSPYTAVLSVLGGTIASLNPRNPY